MGVAQRNASLKGQISRADLLRCLQCHGEDSISGLAIALGYSIKETEAYIDVTMPAVIVDAFGTWQDSPAASVIGTEGRPKAKFHRVIAKRELDTAEVATDPPEWFKTAERFQDEAELSADPTRKPPKPQPLMRWSRLWPFLKCALGEQHKTQAVDLPPVVNKLARGEALSMLPRKCRAGWAESCQIIIDFAEPLLPFWGDFNTLQQRLRRFRGGQGLSIIAFPQGDPFGECWRYADNNWVTHEYRKPAPGTPILLLSDLGCNDQTDTRQRLWRRFGLRLKRAGHRPVVLLPSPSRWWDAEVTQWFYPVCWDRASKPPRRPGQRRPFVVGNNGEVRKDADPGAEQLLALLAPAIRVEPALLRAVRYLLQPRLCDVGSEAAVWNHPKITATPLAFYYPGTAQGDYRQRFQEQAPALRQRAGELITVHHAHLSPAIVQEEQWLLAELSGQSMQASRDFLARIVKTMQSEHEAFEGGMQAWLARMIQRQPKELFANNEALAAAWLLAQKPKMQAGEAITPPAGVNPSRLRWLLAAAAKDYTLRQRGMTLRLELGPKSAEDSDIAGSFFSTISMATDTLQIQQANDAIQLQHRDQPIALNPQGQLRLQTDWHELTIDSIAKPEWAESIGRDAHGLFVTWADGQRKAYWLAPDRYPVTLRGGRVSKAFELNSGFWCDESEALILQREGFQQPKWAEAFGVDEYGLYAEFSVKGVMQRMRWIAPGEFMMGSPEDEPQREDDEVLHKVILSQGFWLADTACTQALWQAVMGDNPSNFKGAEWPVESVSWEEAQQFIQRINQQLDDEFFRLPTEAEWEYACRAGTQTPFWFGEQITPEQVNYNGKYPYANGEKGQYRGETVDVKALPCNSWGLYQMHGNVYEWCQDWYGAYPAGTVTDPTGPDKGGGRVLRGGGWFDLGRSARSANRNHYTPDSRNDYYGFRFARGQVKLVQAPEASAGSAGQRSRSGVGQGLDGRV